MEAFGYKEDRIADFLKAQRAEAEISQREAERFQHRHKGAENRERLKQMLGWFMLSRGVSKLRGEFNTISLQANSTPSLSIQEVAQIPASFYRARIDLAWTEWIEVLESLPAGSCASGSRPAKEGSFRRIFSGASSLMPC